MAKFSLNIITGSDKDTVGYNVDMHGNSYFVDEFIKDVLSKHPDDHGFIIIASVVPNNRKSRLYAKVDYRDGEVVGDISTSIRQKPIVSAKAGSIVHNQMNYVLYV